MTARIVYLPGDGVGPEVGAAALTVLRHTADIFALDIAVEEHVFGGAAIDAAGSPFPDETRNAVSEADAVLLGAIGGPKWDKGAGDKRPERGLLDMRKALGVWANLRPIKPHPRTSAAAPVKAERLAGVDILFVRELTGGLYFGEKGRDADSAFDTCAYSRTEIERVVARAVDYARGRRKRVTSVDKANVLDTSRLWREVVEEAAAANPDIEFESVLVDAAAMHLISDPRRFDVVVTENLFGDILTDEASVLLGSLGLAPSASVGDGSGGVFEPIHGSAPDIAGTGKANPVGMILSAALMLRYALHAPEAADAIERGVEKTLNDGVLTAELGGQARTGEVADAIRANIDEKATVSG